MPDFIQKKIHIHQKNNFFYNFLFEQQKREAIDEDDGKDIQSSAKGKRESQNFWRQVNSVVNDADVILHILDSRDPEGTRCKNLERLVASTPGKKLVLVLNKIDLIPVESAKAWLKYYRKVIGPCLAFRANTQNQSRNLTQKGSSGKIAKDMGGAQAMLSYDSDF